MNSTFVHYTIAPRTSTNAAGRSPTLKECEEVMREMIYGRYISVLGLAAGKRLGLMDKPVSKLAIKGDRSLIRSDYSDQSDPFYAARRVLKNRGFNEQVCNDDKTGIRKKMYSYIRLICEEELGVKRHEIGIFVHQRAQMIFNGETLLVGFDDIKDLIDLGSDIILVEKEGLIQKLIPYTENKGIAFIHSEGFVSEYGIELAKYAANKNANVMVLTDFDSQGILIGMCLGDHVTRIGIGLHDIIDLGIEGGIFGAISENSLNKNDEPTSGWTNLETKLNNGKDKDGKLKKGSGVWKARQERSYRFSSEKQEMFYRPYLEQEVCGITYIDYLKTRRIELNAVVEEIGAARFWSWLEPKILQVFNQIRGLKMRLNFYRT